MRFSSLYIAVDLTFLRGVKSGNTQFARDVAAWTFQESLVLRIDSTTHHLVNSTTPLEQYTTNDNIVRAANGFLITFKHPPGLHRSHFALQPQKVDLGAVFRPQGHAARVYDAGSSHSHCSPSGPWIARQVFCYLPRPRSSRCI